jgi:type VI secretion system secreted protein Hcp
MALNAYMRATGAKSGQIKGGVTQKGREDSIMVIAASHEVVTPRDPASGLPTGKRMHKPFIITKHLDKSSPILWNVLVNNENLTKVTIEFWSPQIKAATGTGSEVQHYTVELTNANIAAMTFRMLNNTDPNLMKFTEFEEVAMVYQAITWTWKDGGLTATDNWEQPVI